MLTLAKEYWNLLLAQELKELEIPGSLGRKKPKMKKAFKEDATKILQTMQTEVEEPKGDTSLHGMVLFDRQMGPETSDPELLLLLLRFVLNHAGKGNDHMGINEWEADDVRGIILNDGGTWMKFAKELFPSRYELGENASDDTLEHFMNKWVTKGKPQSVMIMTEEVWNRLKSTEVKTDFGYYSALALLRFPPTASRE